MAGTRRFRGCKMLLGSLVAAALLAGLTAAHAVTTQRINVVDNSVRSALSNNISPRVRSAVDLGPARADRQLQMSLRFSLTAAQQVGLNKLLADQQNPTSASYHQWLTPEEFGTRFGLSASDLAQTASWLSAQGFNVIKVSRAGLYVRFTGTVAQANHAFSTNIENVRVNGVDHIANLTAPSLPKAIANVTAALTGLHDFTPTAADTVSPEYTFTTGAHYLAPADVYTIYDVNGLLTSSTNGSGVALAVVGQSDVTLSDIASFRSAAGLSATAPTVMLYGADPGASNQADVKESTVALEWAGALAPSANLIYVNSTDVINGSMTEVIDNNLAPVIANTYGSCEANIGATDLAYYQTLLEQAATEGITIVSSSGDSGATDCDAGVTTATHGFAVDFPASSPFVTGVGGTAFNEGTGTYWNAANGSGGSSATSYIPEVAWNDSGTGTLAASGGGASLVFPKPSWQIGAGVPADASRDVPDVAFSASPNHDPYLICLAGSCSSGFTNAGGSITATAGTSVTSPVFAGLMTLVVQKHGRVGVANNTIYALANSAYAANVFHDITSGTNASPCTTGSADCAAGGTIGFNAGVGYDQVTGWGSVDAMNLVTDWALVAPLTTTPAGQTATLTNLTSSAATIAAGGTVNLTATVASASTTSTAVPTGTLIFTVDSVTVNSATLDASGTASLTFNTSTLSAGTHKLQATYSGDGTYFGSKGAFVLTVTGSSSTAADFTLTPANVSLGVTAGTFAQGISYTVTPRNGFTGTVAFNAVSSTAANITKIFSSSSVTITGTAPATTTLTLAAYTGGDLAQSTPHFGWQTIGSGLALAGLLVLLVPGQRRRRMPGLLVLVLGTAALTSLTGCLGNGSSSPASTTSTKTNAAPGTYALTVTATSTVNGAAVTHTSNITLTVQ